MMTNEELKEVESRILVEINNYVVEKARKRYGGEFYVVSISNINIKLASVSKREIVEINVKE